MGSPAFATNDDAGGGASPRSCISGGTSCSHATFQIDAKRWNEMISRMDDLQTEILQLQQRNREKDRGKEFESSYTRVIFLMAVTYFTLLTYMALVIKSANPYLDAIVPTVGFNISTWSLPYVKEWWIQARHYYIHGETERASIRRLMVAEEVEQETAGDVECGDGGEEEQKSSHSTQPHHEDDEELAP